VRRVFFFWLPLAATWLMMSAEGPFLAAVIARLPDPKINLAAYGVAFAVGLLVEAPVIMMMSAATALVKDRDSYLRLRNFSHGLSLLITVFMLCVLIPGVFDALIVQTIGLSDNLSRITYVACWILLPWPGTIGFRRFYQGILIRSGRTRYVAAGTILRITTMSCTGLVLYHWGMLEGAWVGVAALTTGVTLEALASRVMAHGSIRELLAHEGPGGSDPPLTLPRITAFYYPLALTAILMLGVQPVATFFLGRGRLPLESLAVFPVVHALVFLFRSPGIAFQEVGIALMGERGEGHPALRRFAAILGFSASSGLLLLAVTPLAPLWYNRVAGLLPELVRLALLPTLLLAPIPGLTVLLAHQRAVLIKMGRTRPITWATALKVCGIIVFLWMGVGLLDWVGVTAAAAALLIGRLAANSFLFRPVARALRNLTKAPPQ